MPVFDSITRTIKHDYSMEELRSKAEEIAAACSAVFPAAGTGNPDRLLSHIELATVLYFKHLRHDPANPQWDERDRVYWTAHYEDLTLRTILAAAGYHTVQDTLAKHRKQDIEGMEINACSSGHMLGIAAGDAFRAKMDGKRYQVFCIMGEPEQQDGCVWEAASAAIDHRLGNLVAIVPRYRSAAGEPPPNVTGTDLIADKYASFGWQVILADGNNMEELSCAMSSIRAETDSPTILIADVHPIREYSGRSFPAELTRPNDGTGAAADEGNAMKIEAESFVNGIRRAIESLGEEKNVVTLTAGEGVNAFRSEIHAEASNRKDVHFRSGRAFESMCAMAAGLAMGGKIPFIMLHGERGAGNCREQIHAILCRNNFSVKIIDVQDGTGTGYLESCRTGPADISLLYHIPGLHIEVPCDALEMEKVIRAVFERSGPSVVLCINGTSPLVTGSDSCFRTGVANVIRYRGRSPEFADAFDTIAGCDYADEHENLAIVTVGSMVAESMRAACVLKEEHGIETRILNSHTVKPLDKGTLLRAVKEIGFLLTVEEYQVGGFGNIIAGVMMTGRNGAQTGMDMIGIEEEGGDVPSAECIVTRALQLLRKKRGSDFRSER